MNYNELKTNPSNPRLIKKEQYWKFTHDNNEEGWEDGTK